MYDIGDRSAIERQAHALVNRRVGELVDVLAGEQQGTYTKGSVGRYVETYFGLEASSDADPDFVEAGVELKTVPLHRKSGPYTAKERTFITAIDYAAICDQPFDGSPLDLKTRSTLYVFYEWRSEISIAEFKVLGVLFHERDELDELMLRELHQHVKDAVRAGRAHELSEGDTWGVGAATKDAGGRHVAQPFNAAEPARRRAFAYKPLYTTRLWQLAKHQAATEPAPAGLPDSLAGFATEVADKVQVSRGVTVAELVRELAPDKDPTAKNIVSVVSRRLLGSEGRRDVEAFERLGVTIRTVRVEPETFLPHEDVSFPAFDPRELVDQEWESSDLLPLISSLYLMVFVAEPEQAVLDARLLGGFFWRPDTQELATMGREWEALRQAFADSRPEERPQASWTEILHVRPHARNKRDTLPLPSGRPYVKSSFWLNRVFVGRLVAEHLGGQAGRVS